MSREDVSQQPKSAPASHVFRLSHRAIWRLGSFAGLSMAGVFIGMALFSPRRNQGFSLEDAVAFIGICGGFGVFMAGMLYYLRWRQPLEITEHGIDGFDVSGDNVFIRWEYMRHCVRYTAYLCVPCIIVRHTASSAAPLQVPLMLERRDEFRSLVIRYAGPECPLAEALT